MGTPCLLGAPLSLMAEVRVNFPLSGLDTVWERTIRRCCGKLELVLKLFLPHKLFCFLWFLDVDCICPGKSTSHLIPPVPHASQFKDPCLGIPMLLFLLRIPLPRGFPQEGQAGQNCCFCKINF